MDELKWMYVSVSIEDFQRKIAFAEKLLEKYGAKYVKNIEYKGYWTLGDGPHAYENVQKRIYKLGDDFIRVDWVYFTQKPFIVLEFSDKIDGPYEDADPFPYDLPDDEFEMEIRFSLGLEKVKSEICRRKI